MEMCDLLASRLLECAPDAQPIPHPEEGIHDIRTVAKGRIRSLARLKQPEIRPATGFQHFAAGEELIHQGDEADHVFIIIEGHAEAYVDGQRVGDVQKDEIFGAMAVFTREKRSATVIASEPCTVMVIPKEQFLSLMQSNPRIAHSLIESMARRIDLLNKEITQLRQPGES